MGEINGLLEPIDPYELAGSTERLLSDHDAMVGLQLLESRGVMKGIGLRACLSA